jgi:hypothetical protein
MELLWGFLIDSSATWGLREMYKFLAVNKFLPHLRQRIEIELPYNSHFIHSGDAGRPIEFQFTINNPNPISLIIRSIDTLVINQATPIAHLNNISEIIIPGESSRGSHTLAIYWPLMHPTGLPSKNEAWMLKATFHIHCFYGDWVIVKESRPFTVIGDWQEAQSQLLHVRNLLGGK